MNWVLTDKSKTDFGLIFRIYEQKKSRRLTKTKKQMDEEKVEEETVEGNPLETAPAGVPVGSGFTPVSPETTEEEVLS